MVDAQSAMPWLVATGVYVQFTALDFAAADAAVGSRDNHRQPSPNSGCGILSTSADWNYNAWRFLFCAVPRRDLTSEL